MLKRNLANVVPAGAPPGTPKVSARLDSVAPMPRRGSAITSVAGGWPAGGRYETALRWGVPASAKIDTPTGRMAIHDDRLVSAALVAVYDDLFADGKLRLGRAKSAIIAPVDPLDPDSLAYD